MIPRLVIRRGAYCALQASGCSNTIGRRGLTVAASEPASSVANVAGIITVSRDVTKPTTKLAVVAKAGTRYQPAPGLSSGLELFAFKNTSRRSALRITREAELLGSQLVSYHTRESVVIEAKFLRENLPYFTELLAEVISQTKYTTYEYDEQVTPLIKMSQSKFAANASEIALDSAHGIAFHHGLGEALLPNQNTPLSKYLNANSIREFASSVYSKSNIAVVADGVEKNDLAKWVGEFFKEIPDGVKSLPSKPSKYYGGEERIHHLHGNSMVLAFPGSSKPEILVLAALLGGRSNIKWTTGFSLLSRAAASTPGVNAVCSHFAHSDAGLLAIQLRGASQAVREASFEATKALKSIAEGTLIKEDITKAIAVAKFRLLSESQEFESGLISTGVGLLHGVKPYQIEEIIKKVQDVKPESVQTAVREMLAKKASVSAVGDLQILPYAEEVGLKV